MKRMTALAVLLGLAVAGAFATNAFAQSSAPGSTPSKPKVTAVPPPPPPPGGPDKLTTQTQPRMPGDLNSGPAPKPLDDIAAKPKDPAKSLEITCSESHCMDLVIEFCDKHGGGLSTNPDGSITCTIDKSTADIGGFLARTKPQPGKPKLASTPRQARSGLEVTCSSEWCMKSIVAGCDKNGGGLSTNPDGSVTCSM
jgi:hypothetical protein